MPLEKKSDSFFSEILGEISNGKVTGVIMMINGPMILKSKQDTAMKKVYFGCHMLTWYNILRESKSAILMMTIITLL